MPKPNNTPPLPRLWSRLRRWARGILTNDELWGFVIAAVFIIALCKYFAPWAYRLGVW